MFVRLVSTKSFMLFSCYQAIYKNIRKVKELVKLEVAVASGNIGNSLWFCVLEPDSVKNNKENNFNVFLVVYQSGTICSPTVSTSD